MNVVPNTQAKDLIGPSALQRNTLPLARREGPEKPLTCDLSPDRMRHFERLASVGALTCSIAHEIKNALVGTRTFVELLAKQNPDCELAELAKTELERIQSLVTDVLRFAARPAQTSRLVHLNQVLGQTVALVRHPAKEKQVAIETSFALTQDSLAGDCDQLKQAFLNVLLNAIDASPAQSVVRVRNAPANRNGKMAAVTIQDSGPGIRPQDRERVFEPFYSTKPGGTGLGLSITRQIIEEHRGSIELRSQAGQGTTVTIFLPFGGELAA